MWRLKLEIRLPKVLQQCSWMLQNKMEAVFSFSLLLFLKIPFEMLERSSA